jgi:hypothetical protein
VSSGPSSRSSSARTCGRRSSDAAVTRSMASQCSARWSSARSRRASLLVGVADPTDIGSCDELRVKLGGAVSLVVVDQPELHYALSREYG